MFYFIPSVLFSLFAGISIGHTLGRMDKEYRPERELLLCKAELANTSEQLFNSLADAIVNENPKGCRRILNTKAHRGMLYECPPTK